MSANAKPARTYSRVPAATAGNAFSFQYDPPRGPDKIQNRISKLFYNNDGAGIAQSVVCLTGTHNLALDLKTMV